MILLEVYVPSILLIAGLLFMLAIFGWLMWFNNSKRGVSK
jgi:hypothetical protein